MLRYSDKCLVVAGNPEDTCYFMRTREKLDKDIANSTRIDPTLLGKESE